jgi:chromosome condensin MukBEF MukE localization factor
MDLVNELFKLKEQLNASINRLKETGSAFALAERDYKVALNQTVLRLRAENMAATLIALVVYGEKEVADLRFKRDIAQTIYETNKEHINATKLNIRIVENQVTREWKG